MPRRRPRKNEYRFRQTLREALSERGKAKQVAIDTGIPAGTLSNWTTGRVNSLPDVEQAFDIAQSLGLSLEYMVTGREPDTKDRRHSSEAIQHIIEVCERDPEMLSMFLQIAERTGYGRPTSPDAGRENDQGV